MAAQKVKSFPHTSKFVQKLVDDKKAVQEAIATNKPLSEVARERGIKFGKFI